MMGDIPILNEPPEAPPPWQDEVGVVCMWIGAQLSDQVLAVAAVVLLLLFLWLDRK